MTKKIFRAARGKIITERKKRSRFLVRNNARQWSDVFKVVEREKLSTWNSVEVSFKTEDEIKILSDIQKL